VSLIYFARGGCPYLSRSLYKSQPQGVQGVL